jgi:hypothetical protein
MGEEIAVVFAGPKKDIIYRPLEMRLFVKLTLYLYLRRRARNSV